VGERAVGFRHTGPGPPSAGARSAIPAISSAGTTSAATARSLRAGGSLTEADTYVRVAPTFTAPEPYDWLNSVQAVGIGRLGSGPDGATVVNYRFLELR
jgi:hypothetical protein